MRDRRATGLRASLLARPIANRAAGPEPWAAPQGHGPALVSEHHGSESSRPEATIGDQEPDRRTARRDRTPAQVGHARRNSGRIAAPGGRSWLWNSQNGVSCWSLKTWVQAVLLVVLFGFFVLGLLAYRTYQAKPPVADRVSSTRAGQRPLHGARTSARPAGVPAQRPHGVRLGLRPRRLPGAGLHRRLPAALVRLRPPRLRRREVRHRGAADDRGLPHATATTSAPARSRSPRRRPRRHRRLVGHYSRFFSEPTTKHGLRKKAITDRARPRAADRVLRLDGVGGLHRAGPGTTTPTPTTGRRSRASTTARRRTWSSGRCCR